MTQMKQVSAIRPIRCKQKSLRMVWIPPVRGILTAWAISYTGFLKVRYASSAIS